MLQQSARSTYQNVHLTDPFLFILHVLSSDDQPNTHFKFLSEGVEHFEDLHCQLSNRHNDDSTKSVHWNELVSIQFFDKRDQIRNSLSRSGPRRDK